MKKLFSFLLATIMIVSVCSAQTFAAEVKPEAENTATKATMYNIELNSEGIVSVTDINGKELEESSISGYAQGNVTSTSTGFIVDVDASGMGGMGVTVKTTCSTWQNGTIKFTLANNYGDVVIRGEDIPSNGERKFEGLFHISPSYFSASFQGIPSGHTIFAQVLIYG